MDADGGMSGAPGGLIGAVFAAVGGLGLGGSLLLRQFFKTRAGIADDNASAAASGATTSAIKLLSEQLQEQAAKLEALEIKFEDERGKRRAAEDRVSELTAKVTRLEQQLRMLGHDPQ